MEQQEIILNEQLESEFKEIFLTFDKDGSNSISLKELKMILKHIFFYGEQEIVNSLSRLDKQGIHKLSYKQFVEMIADNYRPSISQNELFQVFRNLCYQNQNFITAENFLIAMDILQLEIASEDKQFF